MGISNGLGESSFSKIEIKKPWSIQPPTPIKTKVKAGRGLIHSHPLQRLYKNFWQHIIENPWLCITSSCGCLVKKRKKNLPPLRALFDQPVPGWDFLPCLRVIWIYTLGYKNIGLIQIISLPLTTLFMFFFLCVFIYLSLFICIYQVSFYLI